MPSTATAPRHPSLPAKPPGPPPAPLIPAKRSGSALKLARWTFTKPSAKNADKRARKMAAKKPMSAAETFINVAELRRQCLRYLDNADLARMIRVRKDLVHDVAQVLYAKVGWELVRDKLCRKKERTRLYCDAVQWVTAKNDFATAGIRRRARHTKWFEQGLEPDPGNNEKFSLASMAFAREICPNARIFEFSYRDKEKSHVRIELDIDVAMAQAAKAAMDRDKVKAANKEVEAEGAGGAIGAGTGTDTGTGDAGANPTAATKKKGKAADLSVSELALKSLKGTIYSTRRDIIMTSTLAHPVTLWQNGAVINTMDRSHNSHVIPIKGLTTFKRVWTSTTLCIRGHNAVSDEHIPEEGYCPIKTLTFEGLRALPQDPITFPEVLARRTDVDAPLPDLESLVIPWQSFSPIDNCLDVIKAYRDCKKLTTLNFSAKHALLHMRPQLHITHLPRIIAALGEHLPGVEALDVHMDGLQAEGLPEIGEAARLWPDLEASGVRLARLKIGIIHRPGRKDKYMNLLYQFAKIIQDDAVFELEPVPGHANKPFDGMTWSGFVDTVRAFRRHLSTTPFRVNLFTEDLYSLGVHDAAHVKFLSFDPATSRGIHVIKYLLHAMLTDPASVTYLRTFATQDTYDLVNEAYRLPIEPIQSYHSLTMLHNRICRTSQFPARWRPSAVPPWAEALGQAQTRLTRQVLDFLEYVEFRCRPTGDLTVAMAAGARRLAAGI